MPDVEISKVNKKSETLSKSKQNNNNHKVQWLKARQKRSMRRTRETNRLSDRERYQPPHRWKQKQNVKQ